MDIHMDCFKLYLKMLYQPLISFISRELQYTENCSSAKHWYCAFTDIPEHWKLFQCKTMTLCIYGYSRTLKTVPVQNIDTVHLQIFQNTENCSSAKQWHCAFTDIPQHWKLFQCKTLTMYICGYSQNMYKIWWTVYLQIFQNTENCTHMQHWYLQTLLIDVISGHL